MILTTVNFPLFFLYFLWAGPCGEIVVVPTVLYYLCSHRSSLAHVWGISVQITVQNVLLRVRVSLGLHVKFSDTFYLILVTPLIYKHVNSKFPNKDVISSKPSELRVLRYLYYDNNHSTHNKYLLKMFNSENILKWWKSWTYYVSLNMKLNNTISLYSI